MCILDLLLQLPLLAADAMCDQQQSHEGLRQRGKVGRRHHSVWMLHSRRLSGNRSLVQKEEGRREKERKKDNNGGKKCSPANMHVP